MIKCAKLSDFSIVLPDRPGELARFAARLREADVNLVGLWGYGGDGRHARFYCVPESAGHFRNFLQSTELDATEGRAYFLSGEDQIGALVKTLDAIAAAGINLRAIQSVSLGGEFGCFVWTDPGQWETLERVVASLAPSP